MKLEIEGLTVEYGQLAAVHGLNLTVGHGELVALVGPSGCGKTTTLGFITGFIRAKAGRVLFDGVDVTGLAPQRRGIGREPNVVLSVRSLRSRQLTIRTLRRSSTSPRSRPK